MNKCLFWTGLLICFISWITHHPKPSHSKQGELSFQVFHSLQVTPGSKEKRGPVGEDTCREKNLDGPTISTVVTEGEQDKTVLSNGKCEKDPGVSSVSNVSRTESPVLTSNNLKDLSDECSADRHLKVSSDRWVAFSAQLLPVKS